jgi:hypothetical protein
MVAHICSKVILHLDQTGVPIVSEHAAATGGTMLTEAALATHDHRGGLAFQFDDGTVLFYHISHFGISKADLV